MGGKTLTFYEVQYGYGTIIGRCVTKESAYEIIKDHINRHWRADEFLYFKEEDLHITVRFRVGEANYTSTYYLNKCDLLY